MSTVRFPQQQDGPPRPARVSWSTRTVEACDAVAWCGLLSLLWWAGTLAGGLVLGAGPSTVAAASLARRRLQGDELGAGAAARAFAGTWRREFGEANRLLLPLIAVSVLLVLDWYAISPRPAFLEVGTVVAAVAVTAVGAVLVPLHAHYDLPVGRYLPTTVAFLRTDPLAGFLPVLLVAVAVVLTTAFPLLGLLLTPGAVVHLDTALCLSAFHRNDERVAAAR